ncbi:hypothetical protein ACIGDM_01040 [Rothia koreensis]|uniref:hypothetical protein n=1 Tax=Rothia koreensis TaxID=592378 RepID=UPI0037C5CBE8
MTNYSQYQAPMRPMNGDPGWNHPYNQHAKPNVWKWLLPLLTGVGGLLLGLAIGLGAGISAATGSGSVDQPKSIYEAFDGCDVDMDSSAVEIPASDSDAEVSYDPKDQGGDLVRCSLKNLGFKQDQIKKVVGGDYEDANNGHYRVRNISGKDSDNPDRLMIWKIEA